MNDFGTCSVESDDYQFEKHYSESLKETNVLIDNQDIARLKSEHGNSTDWDYIFVDEAQDWKDDEKLLLFKIYGPNCIVVADGIDQFMRQGKTATMGALVLMRLLINTINHSDRKPILSSSSMSLLKLKNFRGKLSH
jgi:thymidine kinase